MPYPAYEPKSMWRPVSSPMDPIIEAEFAATVRPSMRTFQTLLAGKIGHRGAPGTTGERRGRPRAYLAQSIAPGFGEVVGRGVERGAHASTGAAGCAVTAMTAQAVASSSARRRAFTPTVFGVDATRGTAHSSRAGPPLVRFPDA